MANTKPTNPVRDYLLRDWTPHNRGGCGRCYRRGAVLYKKSDRTGAGVCMDCAIQLGEGVSN